MFHFVVDIPGLCFMSDCIAIEWDERSLSIVLASGNVNRYPITQHRKEVTKLFDKITNDLRSSITEAEEDYAYYFTIDKDILC